MEGGGRRRESEGDVSREEQSRDTRGFLGRCLGATERDWFLGAGK